MTHTANHAVPESGKFRRAVAAGWAFLQAMEFTSFDYTLDRIERLEREVARLKEELRQKGESWRRAMPTSLAPLRPNIESGGDRTMLG